MSKHAIADVRAWEALDSRGDPTVACEVRLVGGASGTAHVPSGASTGRHEAIELRDGGDRYFGRGVRKAVGNIHATIRPAVLGLDAEDGAAFDASLESLDPSRGFGRLGANAILGVSLATRIASAAQSGERLYRHISPGTTPLLPLPMVNILSGGAHAQGAIDVQDFLVIPIGAASFSEAIEWAGRVRRATATLVSELGTNTALVADEGGLGPSLPANRSALELLARGIEAAGLRLGEDAAIAIDVAASQLINGDGDYTLAAEHRDLTSAEMVGELSAWAADFPIVSIEDGVAEDDWSGWANLSRALNHVQLLGDDLFVTNLERLERGVREDVANAVLVKPNQNGTLTGAWSVVERARGAGYATIVSARSGETEDAWLADLAVGWRAGQIKVGSTTRSERTAKWNRLLQIEAENPQIEYAGGAALAPL